MFRVSLMKCSTIAVRHIRGMLSGDVMCISLLCDGGGDNQVPITTISVQVPCSCISMIFQFRCSGHNIAMCAFYLGNPSGTSRCMKLSTATTACQALLSTECIISAISLFLLVFKPAWACTRYSDSYKPSLREVFVYLFCPYPWDNGMCREWKYAIRKRNDTARV